MYPGQFTAPDIPLTFPKTWGRPPIPYAVSAVGGKSGLVRGHILLNNSSLSDGVEKGEEL